MVLDSAKTLAFTEENWQKFVEGLQAFVRVPNLTPSCDKDYYTNGLVQQCFKTVNEFVASLEIKNLTEQVFDQDGKAPPMHVYNIAAHEPENLPDSACKHIMLYGHVDKQPWGADWETTPNDPVIKGDKMFGRGSSDDGYSAYLAFLAIKNLQNQGVPTPRITVLLESEEESGSVHILDLMDDAKEAIGAPEYIFILDSGTLDYESLWVTSSMRGIVNVDVEVDVLSGGVHSGVAGGLVPEPHRVMRQLLDRIEDTQTGMIKLPEVSSPVPAHYNEFAKKMVADLGDKIWDQMPLVDGCSILTKGDNVEAYLRNTWHAAGAVIGFAGLPETYKAGNAMNPRCSFRYSVRISPDRNPDEAANALVKALSENVPYGARVKCDASHKGNGYNMKQIPDSLSKTLDEVSQEFYGKPCKYYGLGATIPLLFELQKKFPSCLIIATGVLGNDCNAHGPNESIDLPYTRKFIPAFCSLIGRI